MRHIAIFGATSAIAVESARIFAQAGDKLFLVARDAQKLEAVRADIAARGAGAVTTTVRDLADTAGHPALLFQAKEALGDLDIVLVAHGVLSNQGECEKDFAKVEESIRVNFLSAASLAQASANLMLEQKRGTIAVISSVAGDRGRPSIYTYASAKGGLNVFLQGLRGRLLRSGIRVITIKPGPVDTPMTAHLKKGPTMASAASVGAGIVRAIEKGKDEVYLPWFWFWIMLIIRLMPEAIFKRIKF